MFCDGFLFFLFLFQFIPAGESSVFVAGAVSVRPVALLWLCVVSSGELLCVVAVWLLICLDLRMSVVRNQNKKSTIKMLTLLLDGKL